MSNDEAIKKFKEKYYPTGSSQIYIRNFNSAYAPLVNAVFSCCGAVSLTGMSMKELRTEVAKQEFVYDLLRRMGVKTAYFLPTSSQIRMYKNAKSSVLNVLFDLGAKEVHVGPNRVHGPNNLHLCVLDTGLPEVKANLERYVVKINMPIGSFGYFAPMFVPRYMAEEFGLATPLPADVIAKKVEQAKKQPLRDAFGRFVKKV